MENKIKSIKDIDLDKMKQETGISEAEIKKAFEGFVPPRKERKIFSIPITSKPKESLEEKTKRLKAEYDERVKEEKEREAEQAQEIKNALNGLESAEEAFNYIENESLSHGEKVLFYDKLFMLIRNEAGNSTDHHDMPELLKYCPSGSPEEKIVREKFSLAFDEYIQKETDIDSLLSECDELSDDISDSNLKNLLLRAIDLCVDDDDCDKVGEHINSGSHEDELLSQKRDRLETEEISKTDDLEELKEIYEREETSSENEKIAIEKMVGICDDFDELNEDLVEFFSSGTYGHQLTIKKMAKLAATLEEINQAIEHCSDHTEEYYFGMQRWNEIFQKELFDADLDRLEEMFEIISLDSVEYEKVMEKKAEFLDDIDDLESFLNDDCSEGSLAYEKTDAKIRVYWQEKINEAKCFDDLAEELDNLPERFADLHQDGLMKLQGLASSEEEDESVTDKADSISYVDYLLSKKLAVQDVPNENVKVSEPLPFIAPEPDPVDAQQIEKEKEVAEHMEKCARARFVLDQSTKIEEVKSAYDDCPEVDKALLKNISLYEIKRLHKLTLPDTSARFKLTKAAAEFFLKKKFFDWFK
ncbi:MAG: hypothetical protein US50_C0039G0013 [Candidatus Nomurabacteria bacterium GW2011_GWB1_37_5]|uniref:Uncharacterized protein n=1 Tax=Candidatus Nomurabacteria bacterium GW2011_GWB1_37_5 TaxID=1618742 RepID=A0A0G0GXF0_9BACT|nr:MAG: hypothetical protein US50_C0039G0013 [Candidatus Nomurabacteria bacterium GW2011_GWB1_37_5]